MKNAISKIGIHVYVQNALEAIELYIKAFDIEPEGEPWLDDEGKLIHQNLLRDGELFIGVSENHHMPDGFISNYFDVCPSMLFCVYFRNEGDFRRAVEVLSESKISSTGIEKEGDDIICDVIDKYGVSWHLRIPKNQNASFIPK